MHLEHYIRTFALAPHAFCLNLKIIFTLKSLFEFRRQLQEAFRPSLSTIRISSSLSAAGKIASAARNRIDKVNKRSAALSTAQTSTNHQITVQPQRTREQIDFIGGVPNRQLLDDIRLWQNCSQEEKVQQIITI